MAKRARFLFPAVIVALPCLLLCSEARAVPPADEAAAEVLFNQDASTPQAVSLPNVTAIETGTSHTGAIAGGKL
jgi:hypothetical protein